MFSLERSYQVFLHIGRAHCHYYTTNPTHWKNIPKVILYPDFDLPNSPLGIFIFILIISLSQVDSPLVDTAFTASQTIITPEGVHVISAEIVDGDSNSKGEAGCHNNGVSVNGTCVCKEGYHGARCELYLACHNYCVRGNCEVDVTG